jgi:hypothetical protein
MAQTTLEKVKLTRPEELLDGGGWDTPDTGGSEGGRPMSILRKSGDVLGRIIGLFAGSNFAVPSYKVQEKYPEFPS